MLAFACPAHAQSAPALPSGGTFVAGSGTIQSSGTTMSITQATGRGVIDWGEFSIGAANQVQIDNATGATLNRVMSGQLSRIDGLLSATGSVYLMNPAGIIVGPDGRVTTGGDFVATTRRIDPAQFMGGGALAIAGTSNGSITNEGSVVSQAGSVVMIAREVTNRGTITASDGRVTLAAADEVLLATTDGKADGIFVSVGTGGGDVTQAGRIEAAAVALQAADGNVFALAGNRDGLVRATGTATIAGELWLTAGGTVTVAGTLAASDADGSGGRIAVNGSEVALAGTAEISATGTRGGEVLVGTSGFATGNDLAERTTIADGAVVTAGGPEGGGLIETSGKAFDVGNATILAGPGGHWLIDPIDVTIDAAAAASFVTSLNGGSAVTVNTAGSGGDGDIFVNADIVWTGTGDLSLDADRDVQVNNLIDGGGSVAIDAGRNIAFSASVSATDVTAVAAATTTIGAAGQVNASAGGVTLETGVFVNQAGAGALTASGDWLVYSGDPANDTTGGLTPDFYQYAAPAGTTLAAAGNGLLYSVAPSVTIALGAVTKDYDGTTEAFLDDSNTTVTGLINGDDWTLEGTYASQNAGTGIAVTADNFAANNAGIPVFGYTTNAPVTASTGVINRVMLTASIVGDPTKTYNATTTVALTSSNFEIDGLIGSETITVNAAATSAYASPDAGSQTVNATFATPNFTAGAGTLLTNYLLPTTATGTGTIDPASLIVSGVTANSKVYDSTTAATLNTAGASIFGIIPGDTVTLNSSGATGTFATEDVGSAIAVTASGFLLGGADAANYVVGDFPELAANITPASLVISGLVGNDKTYDGTTTASLDTTGVQFTGLIAGDDVLIGGSGAQVNFASKNAGTDIPITITGVTLNGTDAGNYDLSYSGSLVADILVRPLTINATSMPTKVYDGTTTAVVGAGGITLDNVVSGESVTLSQAADVQYANKNVGVWDITGTLTPADYVAGPGTLLANYGLPTSATTQGEITPAPLNIVIVANPTKSYDGNPDATLGPGNFAVTGFVAGEGADVTQTSGEYASSDAGVWTVTADLDEGDFDPDPGTLMSNYMIPSPVYGPGTITRIPLGPGVVTVDITGNPSKVYDGNTIAILTSDDYTLGGFIPGEGATITETQGTYDSKDAGSRAVLVLLDPSDFDPDPGTNLDNYTLPTQATGVGTIFQRALTASIVGNPTKVYNGTTRAVVNPSNYVVAGTIAGESITVAPGVVANYASEDAGIHLITANFTSSSNFMPASGTLLANYFLPVIAQGPGTITPAPLLVLGITAQNKVYDQTTVATLGGTASLFGVVAGDTVLLQGGSAAGVFAQSDVGTGIAVTVSGYGISGTDSGNYQLFQPTGLNANITQRGLTIANVVALDRLYDGTTDAQLTFGALTGVLAGDIVNLDSSGHDASFLQKDIGTNLAVNVGGFAISGADAGNYSLAQPGGVTADINPVQLTGAILGNPTKTYDGTTSVSLGAGNYSLAGFIPGEGGAVTQSAGSSYDSANAGARTVTATLVVSDITPNAGTLLSNYLLPAPLSGPGTIIPAPLIVQIVGNPTKVYDSTTDATLTPSNYQLQGFVSGEGATITQDEGEYDTKNVGSRTVTASLAEADYDATGTTNLDNYILPTSAAGPGTITPFAIQVIDIAAADKEYDGNTSATLINTNADLDAVFAGDAVTLVTTGATGTFATRNVGTDIAVTAVGYTISGADAGNYTLLQPDPVLADIFAREIALASVTRVYTADTPVPTVNSAYTLSGVVSGDSVGVNAAAIVGDYIDKNVGTGKSVTIASGIALNGADAGNYVIDPGVSNALIGIITPATLTVEGVDAVNRIYNQNATVDLDNSATNLAGVLSNPLAGLDDVTLVTPYPTTGEMQNANAGTNKPVTISGFDIQGADIGNYILVQPDYVTVDIARAPITLIRVEKVYDGTTALPTASAGYGYAGIFAGDNVTTSAASATGQYATDDAAGTVLPDGTVSGGILVDVAGLTLGGEDGGNYAVAAVDDAPIGVITRRPLTVAIVGTPTKEYDGDNTYDLLTNGSFQFSNFVSGESVTVTQTDGLFNSQHVDEADTITASLIGEITWDNALETNYIMPDDASGAGAITAKPLTIVNVDAENKVYDGTTDATLLDATAALVGIVSPDAIGLDKAGAVGTFTSPDVDTDIPVTVAGYVLTGNDHGNYSLVQPDYVLADITAKLITLTQVTRIYDGTTDLPTVNSAYTLSGIVAGDVVFVDGATAAAGPTSAYADKDVATGIGVTINTLQLTGADATNYSIVGSITNQAIGTITPKELQVAIIGDPTKIYDGNTLIDTLTNANYAFTGFVTGEGAIVSQNEGNFNSKDVLTATTITAVLTGEVAPQDAGTDLANYVVPGVAMGPGTITAATVAVSIDDQTKVYDGNAVATLTDTDYAVTGFVAGEGAIVTQATGAYDSPNVIGATTVSATITGTFDPDVGTDLTNYILPSIATGNGTITPAAVTAAIIGNPTKVYNGNTNATLTPGNYELTGFVGTQGATVSQTAGSYALKDAGTRLVTALLNPATHFTATGGAILSNYNLPVIATGNGTIEQAPLAVTIIGDPSKVYDGDTLIDTLTNANYTFTGFVAGEGAIVSQNEGTFNSKDVATADTITASLIGEVAVQNAGTNLANYLVPEIAAGPGTITAAPLAVTIIGNPSKVYDGTTVATLDSGSYSLTGFVADEGADVTQTLGSYALKDVGIRIVTADIDGFISADPGTELTNYVLPTMALGPGTISQATLTVRIVGLPTKAYDATDDAELTSSNFELQGFVLAEGATITQTDGTYASPDAGIRAVSAVLDPDDHYAANLGTDLDNYVLPTSAAGFGIIERLALTATIVDDPTKTYDANTDATLTVDNFALAGFVAGQGATVTETAGSYDSANAGSRTVTAALGSADFTANAGTSLLNYILPTSAAGPGTIDPALVTAAIIGNPTKVYDGNTGATLNSGNYSLTGFVAGQGATVSQTVGAYSLKNVGSRTITALLDPGTQFTATGSTLLSNYTLPTIATGPGTITQATVTAAIIGNPTRVYDGTSGATLTEDNFELTGFVAGEGAEVTQTVGTYSLKDVGSRTVTASLDPGADFDATGTTLLSNYTLPTIATGPGTITQATVTAAIIGNPTKVYDGNTDATLTSGNYSLTGFVAGEGATVSRDEGTYALKDVGIRVVTANLDAGTDFTATGSTLLSNYILPTVATGPGTITRATITAGIVGNPTRAYDGTTVATLDSSNYSLTGFVAGEGATVTETIGAYSLKDVGLRTVTATLTGADYAATGSTLLSNYTLPTSATGLGTITRATLVASIVGNPTKVYDGNTTATLTSSNYQLTGFVAGEGATVSQDEGTYSLKDAGLRTVMATLAGSDFTATGSTLLGNYTLPTSAAGPGTITRATVTAAIVGNPTKVYDGNTTATLDTGNYSLTGFVSGEGATVNETVGAYGLKDAGTRTVTAALTGADFTATGSTLLSNYTLPNTAAGLGTITRAVVAAAIVGNPTKVYDGNSDATLTPDNFELTGFVAGEGADVTQTLGTYALEDVGLRSVTAALDPATQFTATGSTLLSNYVLPTSANGLGTITRATLAAAIVGNPTKVYDGNTNATLSSDNFELTGFVAGEGADVTQTLGTYGSKDAGTRTVTADINGFIDADLGTDLGNYILPTSAGGLGTITRALITAAIVGTPTKVYDGNTDAALNTGNFELTGFIGGEGADVTQTLGTYGLKDVGIRTVTADLDPAIHFTATGSTLLSNYVLPTEASGLGTITRATITAAIVGNPTKVYDGNTDATLNTGNFELTGFVAGEGADVTQTFGTYSLKDVGLRTVTADLDPGLHFTAIGSTLLSNYILPTSASGLGTITRVTLTAAIVGNPTKVYDGNTGATLTEDNYLLSGFVDGEGATVGQTFGRYNSPNVLTATTVTADIDGYIAALAGTDLGNYLLPTEASGAGTITAATLAAAIIGNPTKVYDGTTVATLTGANFELTGFVDGEGANVTQTVGTYSLKDVGSRTVAAELDPTTHFTATGGTLLSNYVLPTSASGAGSITPATLTVSIIGNPAKIYDGNSDATLTDDNYQLTGFVAGEGATVTETFGTYDSADAGLRMVTAILGGDDFAADLGTLLSNYILPTEAAGTGTILPRPLVARVGGAIVNNPTKIYDGTTVATLTPDNYLLEGFIGTDGATVSETIGAYADRNVGVHQITATLTRSDFVADPGTNLNNYLLPSSVSGLGTINPAPLIAAIIGNPTKTYDRDRGAVLTSDNYMLTGFVAGEGATVTQTAGTYGSPNAGTRLVTATLAAGDFTAGAGTLLSNYVLPTSAEGLGTIVPRELVVFVLDDPVKLYDGSTDANIGLQHVRLGGLVGGETVSVQGAIPGSYAGSDVGLHLVTVGLTTANLVAGAGTDLSNYTLRAGTVAVGRIIPAPLTATLIDVIKTYDGTTTALLDPSNFVLTGFAAGEGATITETMGLFASRNAGQQSVSASLDFADFVANSGTLFSNYVLPTSATGLGLINRADLVVAITGNPTKSYDGNTDAVLVPGDYTLTGFIAGEGATILQPFGTYAAADPGTWNVTAQLAEGDFSAGAGTLLSNYNLPTVATGPGTILDSVTPVPFCTSIFDCLGPDLALAYSTSRFTHFYIVYPSTYAQYQANVNAFAGLPSILLPASFVRTATGWVFYPGTTVVNSAEQILSRGGNSFVIQVFYDPPLPPIELGGEEP